LRLGVWSVAFVIDETAKGSNGIAIDHYAAVLTVDGCVISYDAGVVAHDEGVGVHTRRHERMEQRRCFGAWRHFHDGLI